MAKVKARQVIIKCAQDFVDACHDSNVECAVFSPDFIQTKYKTAYESIENAPAVPSIKRLYHWNQVSDDFQTRKLTPSFYLFFIRIFFSY